jgi:hypothetical protein
MVRRNLNGSGDSVPIVSTIGPQAAPKGGNGEAERTGWRRGRRHYETMEEARYTLGYT